MSESYTTGGDTLYTIEPPALIGQTFSPLQAHILEYIDINAKVTTIGGKLWATLHDLEDDPNMIGGGISYTKFTNWPRRWFFQVSRIRFTMKKCLLQAGHPYGILIHSEPAPSWNKHKIQYDKDDATYPRGKRFTKADWAAAPVYFDNDDLIFVEFGEPPPPAPIEPLPSTPPSTEAVIALMDMLIASEEEGLALIRLGIIKKPLEHEMEAALSYKRNLLELLEQITVKNYPSETLLTQRANETQSFSEYYFWRVDHPEDREWPLTTEENLAFANAYADIHDYLVDFLAWLTEEPPPVVPPPPPLPPPPNPPVDHWYIRQIVQELTATGYRIYIITDVPCHLWMRWTTTEPRTHKIPVLRRGLYLHADVRICFVTYEDNEQEEPGDTILHTFVKEPWPVCETRWFIFWGTVDGKEIPSTSGLFSKHRVAPIVPLLKWDWPFDIQYADIVYLDDHYGEIWHPPQDFKLKGISVPLSYHPDFDTPASRALMRLYRDPICLTTHGELLAETEIDLTALPEYPDYAWYFFPFYSIPVTFAHDYLYSMVGEQNGPSPYRFRLMKSPDPSGPVAVNFTRSMIYDGEDFPRCTDEAHPFKLWQ